MANASSSSSSSSGSSAAHPDLDTLHADVARSNSFQAHLALVSALRSAANLDALRAARLSFFRSHLLPPAQWSAWISDERALVSTPADCAQFLALLRRAVFDCPIPDLCATRLSVIRELADTLPDATAELSAAMRDAHWLGVTAHFTDAHAVFAGEEGFPCERPDLPAAPLAHHTDSHDAQSFAVFEDRLSSQLSLCVSAPSPNSSVALSTFASYAALAADAGHPRSALCVLERAVAALPATPAAWDALHSFAAAQPDAVARCAHVARRAVRAVPHHLAAWRWLVLCAARPLPTRLPSFSALCATQSAVEGKGEGEGEVKMDARHAALRDALAAARPHVLRSAEMRAAHQLCVAAWTAFVQLGRPPALRDDALAALDFNVCGSPEWASATCVAARALLLLPAAAKGGDEEGRGDDVDDAGDEEARALARALLDAVVTARPGEARWWLAYANALAVTDGGSGSRGEVAAIYERAVADVPAGTMLDVLEDAWIAFEFGASVVADDGNGGGDGDDDNGEEGVDQRVARVIAVTNARRAGAGGAQYEEREMDEVEAVAVDKRKRKERGGKGAKRRKTWAPDETNGEVSGKGDGDVKMETDDEQGKNARAESNASGPGGGEAGMDRKGSGEDEQGKEERKEGETEFEPKTIYVNNMPFEATEDTLREFLQDCGEIQQIRWPRRGDGASKGFAYVQFEQEESVEKAVKLHNSAMMGRTCLVRRSQVRPGGRAKGRGGQGFRGGRGERDGRGGRGRRGMRGARGARVLSTESTGDGKADRDGDNADVEMNDEGGEARGKAKGLKQADFRAMLGKRENS